MNKHELEHIYKHYNIHPVKAIRKSDSVFYISDGVHQFALNRKKMGDKERNQWQQHLQIAEERQLQSIIPVYLTKKGRTHVSDKKNVYYITPWIREKYLSMDKKILYLYETIGDIHASTKQTYTEEKGHIEQLIEQVMDDVEKDKEELFYFVRQFESNRYMSPFELQVCMHYHQLEQVIDELLKRLYQLKDQKETNWNYSLCHCNLKESHLLIDEQPYIIHWERALYEHSCIDLLYLFRNYLKSYDAPIDLLIKHFSSYTAKNELTDDEKYLLCTHLLHPKKYLSYIKHYNKHGKSDHSMIKQVQRLEVCFRQLQFGLRFSTYIDQHNNSFFLAEEDT